MMLELRQKIQKPSNHRDDDENGIESRKESAPEKGHSVKVKFFVDSTTEVL